MKTKLAVLGALLMPYFAIAQIELSLSPLSETFAKPLDLDAANDASPAIYVTEKDGYVQYYDPETKERRVFLDLTDRVDASSDGGVLAMTFHPSFPDSNYIYVNYTGPDGNPAPGFVNYISRFTVMDGMADVDSERRIISSHQSATTRNFGDVVFGPDGYLYLSTGDGGGKLDSKNEAQNPQSLKGKILRIDIDQTTAETNYRVPADNPFVFDDRYRPEIWALGLRNPWRMDFDPFTGDLYIGDRGRSQVQEINYLAAGGRGGKNFGWPCQLGDKSFGGSTAVSCPKPRLKFKDPRLVYPFGDQEDIDGGKVTGGVVYNGPISELQGSYIFGDFYNHKLFILRPGGDGSKDRIRVLDVPIENLSAFGEDGNGNLYALDYNGTIFMLDQPKSTSLVGLITTELGISPNPATDHVSINLPGEMDLHNTHAVLVNSGGKTVRDYGVLPATPSAGLSIAGLSAGMYFLRFQDGQNLATGRLVVR